MKDTTTERVGRYQLLEPIGIGPCGTVSRAKVFGVAGFERQFAVKRFHPELTITSALAQALSAAARSYGSLEHPRIARMSEFGVAQGQTFTAVEYVPGLDAMRLVTEARLGGTTLAAGGALALVSQAARAVGYAHGRGLTHLGLAPTNVIVTPDGDIKITDFSVLAAGLPQRPTDVARLQQRIPYLSPEQLTNEATSAATDVFALGVIAYELVTGERTFRGDNPQQIAQAILGGPPPEPPLPRPIVRVLHRCLARSPFERFPDARALADALDAALRVAPVPGTRKDIGAQVKASLERIAALHEGEMSGVLALNIGTGPIPRSAPVEIATLGRDSEPPTGEFVRPDTPVPGPTPLVGPTAKFPDVPRSITTMPGIAPPKIPVPSGLAGLGPPPVPSAPSSTMLGITNAKAPPAIPAIKAPKTTDHGTGMTMRTPSPTASPSTRGAQATAAADRALTSIDSPPMDALFPEDEQSTNAMLGGNTALGGNTLVGGATVLGVQPPPSAPPREALTDEMSPLLVEKLNDASTRGTAEMQPLVAEAFLANAMEEFPDEAHVSRQQEQTSRGAPSQTTPPTDVVHVPSRAERERRARAAEPKKSKAPLIALSVVVIGGALGVGGWQLYKAMTRSSAPAVSTTKVAVVADAGVAKPATIDAAATQIATVADAGKAAPPADAAQVAVVVVDAGKAAPPVDAAVVTPTPSGGSTDKLKIASTPAGAHVYLDGAEAGVTPLELPGTADRHTIALLLPGHDLYVAQVDGHGAFAIPLKEITPSAGPAGIKVIKCKDKDRYYVYVDGKPTGMMCPTERVEVDVGPHTVEVYDAITESRKKWDIVVKDTRLSFRVKLE